MVLSQKSTAVVCAEVTGIVGKEIGIGSATGQIRHTFSATSLVAQS
ncbi:hypothetical protein ZOD2009_16251 [Haladaptatus paucihalophilus DX253]|uniref:Uncharacterized protein n=1 Tax=Haladaptatus paucihalophilus DX253 TaxID=797209 RepID=E7QWR2_HALPU|nr:hypothetical protein ZOD2009_16251 [Haladaptatus paucihalophilus DX253]